MENARILIVEDQNIIAMDLKDRLTHLGYSVAATLAYGEEAIEKVEELAPQLVLMDIVLKGEMDGVQAAELIRQRFDLPIIYLTAHSDEQTLQRAKLTEPYAYILKPFEDRELLMAIEIALYKHRVEAKLKENERWLAATLTSIGDAVIATDSSGRIRLMNPIAEALTGWAQAEAAGQELSAVFKIISEETRVPTKNPVARVLHEGLIVGLANHTVLVARDGTEIPIEDSAAPIRDERGNITGVVLVFHDITKHKQLEQALIFERNSLERRVTERTRELTEANGKLTELDRMKDRFVSNVSHELRTPLANTKLYLQLLERGKPDKRAEYMQTLHREVSHLEGRIEDLLDLSQLEQDKTEVRLAPVDLNALLKQASVVQQPRAETAGLGLTFEPAARPLLARGDLIRLQQVATNLITNAINYTLAGAVHIRSFHCGDRVGFEVRDSGLGIAPEDLPHVFERFYRGKRASRSSVRGTGLGLNIVKEIVDWHGGQIEVDSQVGCGSSFTVYLPSADAAG